MKEGYFYCSNGIRISIAGNPLFQPLLVLYQHIHCVCMVSYSCDEQKSMKNLLQDNGYAESEVNIVLGTHK